MLYRNRELVTKKTDPDIFQEIEKIAASGKPYIFRSIRKIGYSRTQDGVKIANPPRVETIPVSTTLTNKEGASETWWYVKYANQVQEINGVTNFVRRESIKFNEEEIYNSKTDAELIWFLLNKSQTVAKKRIFLYDSEMEELNKNEQRSLEAEVNILIYSKTSPLSIMVSGGDTEMKKMAAMFGVAGVDKKPFFQIQNELWEAVKRNEESKDSNRKGYQAFLNAIQKSKTEDKRANITLAIERKILEYEDYVWHLKTKGGVDQVVYNVPIDDDAKRNELLIDYLEKSDRWYRLVVESLDQSSYNKKPEEKISVTSLVTKKDLQPYCDTYKVRLPGRNLTDVRQELLGKAPDVFKE